MTAPIEALSALSGVSGVSGVSGLTDAAATTASTATSASSGTGFAQALENGLNAVQESQKTADDLAVGAATGNLTDISKYSIAATQASLMTELATSLRTKGVDAFNQIMNMQA